MKSSSEGAKASEARRRGRDSGSDRKGEKFVKTGFDNKKF
jgi:hypothetical protein